MTHLAIVKVSTAGRIEKFAEYATAEQADAHVARVLATYPQAFSAAHPGGGPRDWLCNPTTKTVSLSPVVDPPQPKPEIELLKDRIAALEAVVAKPI